MFRHLRATTLVEIIFYFSILGVLLLVAITFAIQVLNVSSLSSNIHDIQSNLDFISQRMIYTIQTAESVDDSGSSFDVNAGVLSLNMKETSDSPTVFTFSNGNLLFQEGSGTQVQLNSSFVQFDYLKFHKISSPKTPDQIVIDAVLSPLNKDISNLQQSFPWHLSISLRNL